MTKRLIPLILLLGAAAGGGWWYLNQPAPQEEQAGLTLYGNIDLRLINLAFDASGRIAEMALHEGAQVSAGQRLASLDPSRPQLLRDAAKAKVAAAQAQLAELLAGSRVEELRKLEAELEAARIESDNARRSASRVSDMAQKKLASTQQADDARSAANAAGARVHALEAALALAKAGPRAESIAAARAALAGAQAELALAEHNLTQMELHAPAAGVVQSRILEPGDMASPARPVYTLALTQPLWARVYVAGPELGGVHPGMVASVVSDSFPSHHYRGWVGYISPSAEFTPKSVQTNEVRADLVYQLHVFVCDAHDELRLGMPVTVTLDTQSAPLADPSCAPTK